MKNNMPVKTEVASLTNRQPHGVLPSPQLPKASYTALVDKRDVASTLQRYQQQANGSSEANQSNMERIGSSPAAATLRHHQFLANNSPQTLQLKRRMEKMSNSSEPLMRARLAQKQAPEKQPVQRTVDGMLPPATDKQDPPMAREEAPHEEVGGRPGTSPSHPPPDEFAATSASAVAAGAPMPHGEKLNNTGLPGELKTGIESLSGVSLDHVKVHYNSDKPAQLHAHAYAQGNEIHIAPGQEQHLPHEAWHVVQQAQGRVRPTLQMKNQVAINNNVGLEREADVMGAQALGIGQLLAQPGAMQDSNVPNELSFQSHDQQLSKNRPSASSVAQRMPHDEIRTGYYYLVRVGGRERVMYLRVKRSQAYTFYASDTDRSAPLEVTGQENVLSAALKPQSSTLSDTGAGPLSGPGHIGSGSAFVAPSPPRNPLIGSASSSSSSAGSSSSHGPGQNSLVRNPFGPYAAISEPLFWERAPARSEADAGFAARMVTASASASAALNEKLDPGLWADIANALDAPNAFRANEAQSALEHAPAASPVTPPQPSSRRSRSMGAATGEAAGQQFVVAYQPRRIAGTEPEIRPLGVKRVYADVPAETQMSASHMVTNRLPGYVLNLPAHISKDIDAVLARYATQATLNLRDGTRRIAGVVAVNARRAFGDATPVQSKLGALGAYRGFEYGAIGFDWSPAFGEKKVSFDIMQAAMRRLDAVAQHYVIAHLFDNSLTEKHLPYGLFRGQAAASAVNDAMIDTLVRRDYDPIYMHVGDPDAVSWTVNNDRDTGVLARYDQVLGGMSERGRPYPPMVIGGYNFGVPIQPDGPTTRLVKLGNIADRAVRRAIAPICQQRFKTDTVLAPAAI